MKQPIYFLVLILSLSATAFAGDYGEGVATGVEGVSTAAFVHGAVRTEQANREFERDRARYKEEEALIQKDFENAYRAKQDALNRRYKSFDFADQSLPEVREYVNEERKEILKKQKMLEQTKNGSIEATRTYDKTQALRREFTTHSINMERLIKARAGMMLGGAAGMVAGGAIYQYSHEEKIEQPQVVPEENSQESNQASAELGD